MALSLVSPRPRKLESWVSAFFEFTSDLPSPELWRKWTGIAIVAGALERKVWVHTYGRDLYPNLYTILCGPPGVGKTVLTDTARELWTKLDGHRVAPSSVTKPALIDELHDAKRDIIQPKLTPSHIQFHSLKIASNELGVLIPDYVNDFMSVLTDIYDGKPYGERRRSKDIQISMERPQINLLAATTPSYLKGMLPEGAWDQGFLSRCLIIYSGESMLRDLFTDSKLSEAQLNELVSDLRIIGSMYGKMDWEPDAAAAINNWHLAGGEPKPDHPKLQHYNTRRTAHLLKLCMVACAASTDSMHISLDHLHLAMDWLVEAEHYMSDIFKAMTTGGDGRTMEEAWYFAYHQWMKDQKPIPEGVLYQFISERAPAHSVARIIEVMTKSEILRQVITPTGTGFVPRGLRKQ